MSLPRSRGVELACLAAGLAILGVTVRHIGLDGVARDLGTIGWGLAVVLLVESGNLALNTAGWALTFPRGERPVSGGWLLLARLAGDGVNYLTPSATVGGELLRIRLLGPGVPASVRWASVSVAKLGQTLAQAAFVLLGLGVVFPRVLGTPAWLAWTLGPVAAAGTSLALVWVTGRGFWATLVDASRRLGLEDRLPASWGAPGRDLDAALSRLGRDRVLASLACFVGGFVVGAAEIYLILSWVGAPVDWTTALALETGSVLIDGILFFVPAKIGTHEGGKVVLFAALGLDPARGLTVAVVRRIRELVFAGLGLAALGWLTAGAPAPRTGRPGVAVGGPERP